MMHEIPEHDPAEQPGDPLAALLARLEDPPTRRCGHIDGRPGVLWWRDLREPDSVLCERCVAWGRRAPFCAVCGVPERGAYVADLGIWLVGGHAVQGVVLLCPMCSSLLPPEYGTYQLSKSGAVRVNRPTGGGAR